MMKFLATIAASLLAAAAHAQTPKPPLDGLSFLIGEWSSGRGRVADTGGTSTGKSSITAAAGGAVLLRRDHTNLFDAAGHATGGFDQLMTIYAENATIHADYFDPAHIIHYTSAKVQPGKSVIFSTPQATGGPSFRLSYTLSAPGTLLIDFAMAPPPGNIYHQIATGTVTKAR